MPRDHAERLDADTVRALLPELTDQLAAFVRIPSISGQAESDVDVLRAHQFLVDALGELGVTDMESLHLPDTAPVLVARVPGPKDAPTVLLYSHYDVVPAGDPAAWTTPAFVPDIRDGAMYGRGTADSKSNVMVHLGAIRAFGGTPPVNLVLVVEGQEEVGSPFDTYPAQHPEQFQVDAMVIADVGSLRPDAPALTVALRGDAVVEIEARTLAGGKHSGQFGGAAPDALTALIHALSTLHDVNGDVAVAGLRRNEWPGEALSDAEFRELAEVVGDTPLMGTGGIGSRTWSGPAITVVGLDAPSVDEPINAVSAAARARLNLRVHPEQSALEAQDALVAHLEALRPFGVELQVTRRDIGDGFAASTDGPAFAAAQRAFQDVWGTNAVEVATGGSIPLVKALSKGAPAAEILLFGTTDGFSDIHAPNERVLLREFEQALLVEVRFLEELGAGAD